MIAVTFVVTIAFIVGLTFALRAVMNAAGRKVGARVADLHRALEQIVQAQRVPAAWIEEMGRKVPGSLERPPRRLEEAKRFLLDRLARLRGYCRKSQLVDGPDTLEVLLDGLARAEQEWRKRSLEELVDGAREEHPC